MPHQHFMIRRIERLRAIGWLVAALAIVAAGSTSSAAASNGLTPETLANAGWTCFIAPVGPPLTICANPGIGRPFPGNPDPPPKYTLVRFDANGNYDSKVHFIRADLYAGQPCGESGEPYVLSPRIPYYECIRTTGG